MLSINELLTICFCSFAGVVPEYQCAVKRKEKKAQKDKDKPNSTTNGSPETIKIEPELQRVIFYVFMQPLVHIIN